MVQEQYNMKLRKRNNYTLSPEAQKIVDAIPKNKSRWVSQAIGLKNKMDTEDFEKVTMNIKGVSNGRLVQKDTGDYEFVLDNTKKFDGKIYLATPEKINELVQEYCTHNMTAPYRSSKSHLMVTSCTKCGLTKVV